MKNQDCKFCIRLLKLYSFIMKSNILFFILFLCQYIIAEEPVVKWVKAAGGSIDDASQAIAVDVDGNVYVTGNFTSATITFGSTALTNSNVGDRHIFVVKFDSIGNVLWAKSTRNNESGNGNSISVDNSGNVYVCGSFRGTNTLTFGSFTLNNQDALSYTQSFIVKYDTSGNVLWAKTCLNNNLDVVVSNSMQSVCVNKNGNAYVTGIFQGPTITFGSLTVTNSNPPNHEVFLIKYDPAGNILWGKSFGGNNSEIAYYLTVDVSDNVFLSGFFQSSSIDFGSTVLTNKNSGEQDMFIAKYNSSGNFVWAKSAGGSGADIASVVSADKSGCAYVGGTFKSNSIAFGSIALTNSNPGLFKNYIVKYDVSGNTLWAKTTSNSTKADATNSLTTDNFGNVYTTGYFESPVITFDNVTLTNSNSSTQDIFVTKYDTSGKVLWAKNFGGSGNDFGKSIAADNFRNVYLTGMFGSASIKFDVVNLTNKASGSTDLFVAKINSTSKPDTITVDHCVADPIAILTANDGYASYSWVDKTGTVLGASKIINVQNPVDGAFYTCHMTTDASTTDTLCVIIINYEPKADFSFQNNCLSNTVHFNNLSTFTNGTLSYKWDFGDGQISTITNPQHTFTTSGIHIVSLEVTNLPSTCTRLMSKSVDTFTPSLVGIDGNLTYCRGESTILKAHGAFGYTWSTGSKSDSIIVSAPGASGWLIGNSSSMCLGDTIFYTVTEEPDWTFDASGNAEFCEGDSSVLTASGAVNYAWNTGEQTNSITVLNPGIYTVTGTNARGCVKTKTFDVSKHELPAANFSVSKSAIDSHDNQISCTIPAQADVQYLWDMGDGSTKNGAAIQHTYNVNNALLVYTITLTATNKFGCTASLSKSVDVIPFIPNVFTPNGDGVNDIFMQDFVLKIYDRYGITLYNGSAGWDGTYNGNPVDPDTYFYYLTYTDKNQELHIKKGYVSLVK